MNIGAFSKTESNGGSAGVQVELPGNTLWDGVFHAEVVFGSVLKRQTCGDMR